MLKAHLTTLLKFDIFNVLFFVSSFIIDSVLKHVNNNIKDTYFGYNLLQRNIMLKTFLGN